MLTVMVEMDLATCIVKILWTLPPTSTLMPMNHANDTIVLLL